MGYNLVGTYEEKISGFRKNEERVVLSQLLYDIDHGIGGTIKIDLVLTSELSRIARNVLSALTVIEQLNSRRVSLYIMNHNLETLNPDQSINGLAMF